MISACRRTAVESMEPRLFFSTAAPVAVEAPYTVLQSEMATPDGYSSPSGAPITPAKMRSAYGLGTYGASNVTFNGVQGTGAGQTIAIIEGGSDPDIADDVAAFDTYWDLPAPPSLQELNATGGTTLPAAGDVGELDLDVEWAHVMAPLANITIYCGSLYTAMTTAKNAPGVSVITVSYTISGTEGLSEFETPSGHQGVTFFASAGDTGGEVNDPAKSPAVVAVGGTDLYLSGSNYSSETAWADGGGGINTAEAQPAYQNGVVSAFSTTQRTIPDVSMDADPSTGVAVYNEYTNGTTTPWSAIIGGTSLSSPLMAGLVAVADQGRVAAGLTTLDGYTQTLPRLYKLASADYHDITTGNNTYAAGVGYDLASGIGSPIANKLVPDLAGADTITGRAFIDLNGNGTYDSTDAVLANQTVYLDLNEDGKLDAGDPTTTTNSSGIYTFSDQIGSEKGIVRLASPPAGDLSSLALSTFTTSYDQTQVVNLAFYPSGYSAVATPSTVTGNTTALSVSGTNPADSATFLYTWSATSLPSGATAPTFSANGTNAAKSATATFTHAGSYVLTLTITDSFGYSVTSSVNVTVTQKPTAIAAVGAVSTIAGGLTVQYSVTDQFGNAITTGLTWTTTGGGTISSSGLFTANQSGGTYSVSASNGSSVSTNITVVPTAYTGTSGASAYIIRLNPTNLLMEQIWVNVAETATPTYTIALSQLPSLSFTTNAGGGSVTIDYADGNPIPAGNLAYSGSVGGNALYIKGSSAGGLSFNTSSQTITNTAFPTDQINFGGVQSVEFDLLGGSNTLTQTSAPVGLTYNAGSGSNTLNVNGGSFTFTTDPQIASGNLTVNDNSAVTFTAGSAGSGFNVRHLAALSVGTGATATIATPAAQSDRTVMMLGALSVASTGKLDLGGNDMIIHTGNIAAVTALLAAGDNGGSWNGTGITSSAAAANSRHLTALGSLLNTTIFSTFDGQSVVATDVLIKYTYVGDANLDGQVDGSDYTKIDNGFNNQLTGWLNGDFNYDSAINGSDYTLIDNAFNTQSASMTSQIASATAQTISLPTADDAVITGARATGNTFSAVFSDQPWKHKTNRESHLTTANLRDVVQ